MTKNKLIISAIPNNELIETAKTLPRLGALKVSDERLVYLDIDDNYIHELFPLIDYPGVNKPDYFAAGIGAHISIIYPNEYNYALIEKQSMFQFEVNHLFMAKTNDAIYFALSVNAPDLLTIRRKNNLSTKLNLNGYRVDMHITIGKIENLK